MEGHLQMSVNKYILTESASNMCIGTKQIEEAGWGGLTAQIWRSEKALDAIRDLRE